MELKNYLLTLTAIVGGWLSYLIGGWSEAVTTLFILMFADYITGIMVSAWKKNSPKTETGGLSSQVGFIGLCKKCLIFVWVIIGYRIDLTLGTNYLKYAVIYACMVNELLSLVENSTLLGFPTPQIIADSIDILKQKSNSK